MSQKLKKRHFAPLYLSFCHFYAFQWRFLKQGSQPSGESDYSGVMGRSRPQSTVRPRCQARHSAWGAPCGPARCGSAPRPARATSPGGAWRSAGIPTPPARAIRPPAAPPRCARHARGCARFSPARIARWSMGGDRSGSRARAKNRRSQISPSATCASQYRDGQATS